MLVALGSVYSEEETLGRATMLVPEFLEVIMV